MQKKLTVILLTLLMVANISYARFGIGIPFAAIMPESPLLEWSFSFDGHGTNTIYHLNSVGEIDGIQRIYSDALVAGADLKLHSNSGREATWYGFFGMGTTLGIPNALEALGSAKKVSGSDEHKTERSIFETKFGVGHRNWIEVTNNNLYYSIDYSFIKTNYYLYFYDQPRNLSCIADGSTLSNALGLSLGYDITQGFAVSVGTSWWNILSLSRSSVIAACSGTLDDGSRVDKFIPTVVRDNKERSVTIGLHYYM